MIAIFFFLTTVSNAKYLLEEDYQYLNINYYEVYPYTQRAIVLGYILNKEKGTIVATESAEIKTEGASHLFDLSLGYVQLPKQIQNPKYFPKLLSNSVASTPLEQFWSHLDSSIDKLAEKVSLEFAEFNKKYPNEKIGFRETIPTIDLSHFRYDYQLRAIPEYSWDLKFNEVSGPLENWYRSARGSGSRDGYDRFSDYFLFKNGRLLAVDEMGEVIDELQNGSSVFRNYSRCQFFWDATDQMVYAELNGKELYRAKSLVTLLQMLYKMCMPSTPALLVKQCHLRPLTDIEMDNRYRRWSLTPRRWLIDLGNGHVITEQFEDLQNGRVDYFVKHMPKFLKENNCTVTNTQDDFLLTKELNKKLKMRFKSIENK